MLQQELNQHANQHNNKQEQLQFQINARKIVVIFSHLIVPQQDNIKYIQLHTDLQNIVLNSQEIVFPKAITLSEESSYKIIIKGDKCQYQGVFIATNQRQNVRLYEKQVQKGLLKIFSRSGQSQISEEDVQIRIISSQKRPFQQLDYQSHQNKKQDAQFFYNYPTAKSPFIKLTIRSIRPSKNNFKLKLKSFNQGQTKVLNFPNENQLLLKNVSQWSIRMIDQNYEDIIIHNYLTSNTYCFIDHTDKKVHFTCIIEIQQCWQPQLQLGIQQKINIIIHFQQILCLAAIAEATYLLSFQNQTITQLLQFKLSSKHQRINLSINLDHIFKKGIIKIINKSNKQVIGQFKLTLLIIKKGIQKNQRYLISQSRHLRLKIRIYQLRYNQIKCKSDRIMSMFDVQNIKTIQSWIKSCHNLEEQQVIDWLRFNFKFTLVQIDVLFQQFLKNYHNLSYLEYFINLFSDKNKIQIQNSNKIKQQFNIFDYKEQGLISQSQLKIINKILIKNYKQIYEILQKQQNNYYLNASLQNNFIIDQNIHTFQRQFDYLSFFNLIQKQYQSHFDQISINNQNKNNNNNNNNSNNNNNHLIKKDDKNKQNGFLNIKIKQFKKLSLNKQPCTFLFKINGKRLAQPIHRCYSHKYTNNNYEVIISKKCQPQLEIYHKILNLSGNWEYKLIQKDTLKNQVKVLGGSIYFQIMQSNQGIQYQPINNQIKKLSPQKTPFKKQIKKQQDQNDQSYDLKNKFGKSYWNKSLNETKQKWSQYKNSKKKRLNNNKLGNTIGQDESTQNKIYKFDKEIL